MRAFLNGEYSVSELIRHERSSLTLRDRMPPVYQQAMRGTCVANAATALVEYYEDCKTRLSVQFLHEMTKSKEREWLDRNLKALEENREVDAEFAAKFPAQVAQIRLTSDANGAGSPAAKAFVSAFARQLGGYFNSQTGSQIKRCFEVIRECGTCRYSLWPYANVQTEEAVVGASFPPGSQEDALKHRIPTGLYLLRSPNNVEEIRGVLAGANGRRPMPVCVGLPLFEGCDGERFRFPEAHEEDGRLVSDNALKDVHEMLIVGFEDDKSVAGGGWFVVRNSWGANWGNDGYGKVPYAYVECFCTEAGTILQDMVDYVGDGYGAKTARPVARASNRLPNGRKLMWPFVLGVLAVVGVASAVLVTMMNRDLVPDVGGKPLPKPVVAVEQEKAAEKETERLKAAEEARRLADEKRLAEERRALEAEKTKLARERREAEERAAAKAKEERLAAEAAAREAAKKRAEAERLAAEAEKRRQDEEAEKRRLSDEAEKRRLAEEAEKLRKAAEAEKRRLAEEKAAAEKACREQAERMARQQQEEAARLAAERANVKEYLVHVTLSCMNEGERDAVVRCLDEVSGSVTGGMTNCVENVTVVEYEAGRNLIGIAQKGYRVRCDVRIVGSGGDVCRPTDEVKRTLSRALNERCQPEDGDRIDWSSFTRMNCLQDFRTADGRRGTQKNSSAGVRIGF